MASQNISDKNDLQHPNISSTISIFYDTTTYNQTELTGLVLNSSFDNSNASRHLADRNNSVRANNQEKKLIVFFLLLASLFIILLALWTVKKLRYKDKEDDAIKRRRKHDMAQSSRPISEEGQTIDTPLSVYPGDIMPDFERHEYGLPNFNTGSVITMTMRNNHLIVETEEQVPCTLLEAEQLNHQFHGQEFINHEIDLTYLDDEYSDISYSNGCTMEGPPMKNGHGERLVNFCQPSTSRQVVDEEDQPIELFYKNISTQENQSQVQVHPIPSEFTNEYRGKTGFTQSDHTDSSSESRQWHDVYSYGNQNEYVHDQQTVYRRNSSLTRSSDLTRQQSTDSGSIGQ